MQTFREWLREKEPLELNEIQRTGSKLIEINIQLKKNGGDYLNFVNYL